jgi:hypothetical protein
VSADAPLRYTVVLDGREQATPANASELRIDSLGLSSGRHTAQLLVTDIDGQSTLSKPATLYLDGVPPTVTIKTRGATVSVSVRDAYSGVDTNAVTVSFGDRAHARGRTSYRHRYAHAGSYQVVVSVRDKLGNAGVVRRLVSVR